MSRGGNTNRFPLQWSWDWRLLIDQTHAIEPLFIQVLSLLTLGVCFGSARLKSTRLWRLE